MARKFLGGFVAAMEDENTQNVAVAGEPDHDLEDELAGATKLEGEADEIHMNIDNAMDEVEALEELKVALEASIQNGGLDRGGASILQIMVKRAYKSAGMRPEALSSFPALESYGGTGSKAGTTGLALEGIKSGIKAMWKAIVKALKNAWTKVKEWYLKIFGSAEKMKARADALEKKASTYRGKAKETTFESRTLVDQLFVGTTGVPKVAATGIDKVRSLVDGVLGSWEKIAGDISKSALDGLEKTADSEGKTALAGGATGAPLSLPTFAVTAMPRATGTHATAVTGAEIFLSAELPGGVAISTSWPTDKTITEANIGFVDSRVVNITEKPPTSEKVETLSTSDAANIAKSVSLIAAAIIAFRSTEAKLSANNKKAADLAEKLEKSLSDEIPDAQKDALKLAKVFASSFGKFNSQPYGIVNSTALTICKAQLDYVEASYALYETK